MSFAEIDPLTQLAFSVAENRGVFAVLIGSGLSRAADIPTGWEITLDLVRRFAAAQGVADQPDWAEWYHDQTGEAPSYSKVLASLAASPIERRAILHSYIEPNDEDRERGLKQPTGAHGAIADLVVSGHVRVIVTTNFDRLMENALRERGVEPTVVASVDALVGAEPITHSTCYVLKLHGDYKDARLLNTDAELERYAPQIDAQLDRIFDEHGLIISGWSGEWDTALRSAMLRASNRRYPVYWTTRSDLKDDARDIALHRGARVVKIADANTFFRDLRDRVQTLERAQRVNPRSVELTIASTKRFLGRPEYRIELDELIAREADHLVTQLEAFNFSTHGFSTDPQEFRDRATKYEAATETMARVAGVLGRWGTGSELAVVCDLVRTLYAHAQKHQSGLVRWVNLRSYPAVLIVTAYALGLTREQRWHDLHKFLRLQIGREEQQPVSIVELYSTSSWRGLGEHVWNQLEGLDRHKTALSDHLLALFEEWGKSFLGLASDLELVFDRFETLESLAHFERDELAKIEANRRDNPNQQFAYCPLGRVGWHAANYAILMQELTSDPMKSRILDAGFAGGQPRRLELFIECTAHVVQRMRWG
jgi:SIR2-like domain